MRVGIWCAASGNGVAPHVGDPVTHTWELEVPEGWYETCATVGFVPGALDLSAMQLSFAGRAGGQFLPLPNDPAAAWLPVGTVSPGRHVLTLTLPSEINLRGVWLSNGPLPHGWPGDLPALAVDEYLLPGQVRPIPVPPPAGAPLEYARPGLASHLNQQGAMGVANGILTAVPRALRLRYVDAEVHLMLQTEAGPRRPKDVCADFELGLLDGDLLCPVARFTYDEVAYTVTFAAVPQAGEAADLVHVHAVNRAAEPRPSRLVAWLDAAADVSVSDQQISASGEAIAYLGETALATVVTRQLGCADLAATTVGDMYSTPFLPSWGQGRNPKYDVAFYSARIGWHGRPVSYRLACPPGAAYTVYLGLFDTQWGGPGQKVISAGEKVIRLSVEGTPESLPVDLRGRAEPALLRFDARDADGDGQIAILSVPDPNTPNAIGFLNAVWVFPAGTEVNLDDLRFGALNAQALHFANVGGSLPGGVVDLVLTEDWSFAYAQIRASGNLPPARSAEWQFALPVNHRAEMLPYSQARDPREAGEGTPAYAPRLAHRHAAARLAAADPHAALGLVRRYWAEHLTTPAAYQVPDPAARAITRTSLAYFVTHRVKLADEHFLPIGGGPLYYFDFSERDCGYGIVGLDLLGRHADTERLLNPYLTAMDELDSPRWSLGQNGQGMWMTRAHEEDTQGQVLWALGEHFMLTQDRAWLRRAWPRLKAGLEYIRRQRAAQKEAFPDPADPRHGLWISGTDESKSWGKMTHSYYFNYWIECGLRLGVLEAEAMGDTGYAQEIRAEHTDFLACLYRSLSQTFWRIDYRRGALPNAAEAPDSTNPWGVQEALYPSQSIPIWDPMVAQTIAYCDALAYPRAGGLTLGPRMLWPSAACDYAMMHLRRGEGDRAVDIFNSLIATCGLVHTWGETIYFSNGLTTGEQPYTWANACYLILQRQLLLHEAGDWLAGGRSGPRELWISPATPRKWLDDPAGVVVSGAPTYFGPVSYTQRFNPGRRLGTAQIELAPNRLPERMVVHFRTPLGGELRRVTINGDEHPYFSGEKVIVAQPPASLEIKAWL